MAGAEQKMDLLMENSDRMSTTVASLADLVRRMDTLTETVDRHAKFFGQVQQDLRALQQKMDSANTMSTASLGSAPSWLGMPSDGGSAPERARRAASAPPLDRPHDPCKVWVGGFPRKMMGAQFEAHWNKVKQIVPQAVHEEATGRFYNLQYAYFVFFSSEVHAKDFFSKTRDNEEVMTWKDPRTGTSKLVRARPDQTLDVRKKQKTPGRLWEPVLQILKAHPRGPMYSHKLGTNGPKGILFVTSADDVWDSFTLQEASDETFTIIPCDGNLQEWGISSTKATEIITAATQ
ncbi:unnamed protein product [Prorocentrum cordatum]|uniref:Uncharacterized protein n=1 Tax=Prorocentrum cordatum TaxID=2364126 RepID=A0ABN9RHM4_9DINO|nr:unnamed protein product [Polarella glacialis]